MKSTDYSKYKYRTLTDDSRLHLDEINGTLEQTGKNEDGTYNFILTVPTRRYKRPVKKCKRLMFGALGFRVRNRKYKFVYLFGFKDAVERWKFHHLVSTSNLYNADRFTTDKDDIATVLKNYNKVMKAFDDAMAEAYRLLEQKKQEEVT